MNMLGRLVTGVVLFGALGGSLPAARDANIPLEQLLGNPALWMQSPEQFITTEARHGFAWLTANQKATARSVQSGLTFLGLPVIEALARFDAGKLKELSLSMYNRGDAGPLAEPAFVTLVRTLDQNISVWASARGTSFRDEERTTAVTIKRKAWVARGHRVDLDWSFTAKSRTMGVEALRPEYVRVRITKFDPTNDPRRSTVVTTGSKTKLLTILDLRARVKRETSGDVLISGIPMVDQGEKGYCAAAVSERVLRYYGDPVDQHEIAQLASTSAESGTSPNAMLAALRRIGSEVHTEVTVHQDFRMNHFQSLVRDYNSLAKKSSKPQITYGQQVDLLEILVQMDNSLFKQARLKRDGDMTQFKTTVNKYINNGVPLVWAVIIGKVEETPRLQARGGHLRLIVGYNDRTREILYSDTWGAGHELKRMALDDAWAITLGQYSIEPRNIRF